MRSSVMPSTEDLKHIGTAERQPVLEIDDLKTWFYTDAGIVKAVNGVTLSVTHGETLAIVGESCSGKSVTGLTVMRLLGRQKARTGGRIEGGHIRFRNRDGRSLDLAAASEREMAGIRGRDIAMIFQDPMSSLNPVFPIGDQIAEPIRVHKKLDHRTARQMAINLLRDVGITDPERRIDAFPHQLSGGMRQRVMIAIALACDPTLLIADEPTTALDVTIQAQILELLRSLQRELGMSILLITHDLGVVAETCDEVVVMYAGRIVERASTEALFAAPRHHYTAGLLRSVPSYGDDRIDDRGRLREIAGMVPSLWELPKGCKFADRCPRVEDRCRAEEPALVPLGASHVRCHFPLEAP